MDELEEQIKAEDVGDEELKEDIKLAEKLRQESIEAFPVSEIEQKPQTYDVTSKTGDQYIDQETVDQMDEVEEQNKAEDVGDEELNEDIKLAEKLRQESIEAFPESEIDQKPQTYDFTSETADEYIDQETVDQMEEVEEQIKAEDVGDEELKEDIKLAEKLRQESIEAFPESEIEQKPQTHDFTSETGDQYIDQETVDQMDEVEEQIKAEDVGDEVLREDIKLAEKLRQESIEAFPESEIEQKPQTYDFTSETGDQYIDQETVDQIDEVEEQIKAEDVGDEELKEDIKLAEKLRQASIEAFPESEIEQKPQTYDFTSETGDQYIDQETVDQMDKVEEQIKAEDVGDEELKEDIKLAEKLRQESIEAFPESEIEQKPQTYEFTSETADEYVDQETVDQMEEVKEQIKAEDVGDEELKEDIKLAEKLRQESIEAFPESEIKQMPQTDDVTSETGDQSYKQEAIDTSDEVEEKIKAEDFGDEELKEDIHPSEKADEYHEQNIVDKERATEEQMNIGDQYYYQDKLQEVVTTEQIKTEAIDQYGEQRTVDEGSYTEEHIRTEDEYVSDRDRFEEQETIDRKYDIEKKIQSEDVGNEELKDVMELTEKSRQETTESFPEYEIEEKRKTDEDVSGTGDRYDEQETIDKDHDSETQTKNEEVGDEELNEDIKLSEKLIKETNEAFPEYEMEQKAWQDEDASKTGDRYDEQETADKEYDVEDFGDEEFNDDIELTEKLRQETTESFPVYEIKDKSQTDEVASDTDDLYDEQEATHKKDYVEEQIKTGDVGDELNEDIKLPEYKIEEKFQTDEQGVETIERDEDVEEQDVGNEDTELAEKLKQESIEAFSDSEIEEGSRIDEDVDESGDRYHEQVKVDKYFERGAVDREDGVNDQEVKSIDVHGMDRTSDEEESDFVDDIDNTQIEELLKYDQQIEKQTLEELDQAQVDVEEHSRIHAYKEIEQTEEFQDEQIHQFGHKEETGQLDEIEETNFLEERKEDDEEDEEETKEHQVIEESQEKVESTPEKLDHIEKQVSFDDTEEVIQNYRINETQEQYQKSDEDEYDSEDNSMMEKEEFEKMEAQIEKEMQEAELKEKQQEQMFNQLEQEEAVTRKEDFIDALRQESETAGEESSDEHNVQDITPDLETVERQEDFMTEHFKRLTYDQAMGNANDSIKQDIDDQMHVRSEMVTDLDADDQPEYEEHTEDIQDEEDVIREVEATYSEETKNIDQEEDVKIRYEQAEVQQYIESYESIDTISKTEVDEDLEISDESASDSDGGVEKEIESMGFICHEGQISGVQQIDREESSEREVPLITFSESEKSMSESIEDKTTLTESIEEKQEFEQVEEKKLEEPEKEEIRETQDEIKYASPIDTEHEHVLVTRDTRHEPIEDDVVEQIRMDEVECVPEAADESSDVEDKITSETAKKPETTIPVLKPESSIDRAEYFTEEERPVDVRYSIVEEEDALSEKEPLAEEATFFTDRKEEFIEESLDTVDVVDRGQIDGDASGEVISEQSQIINQTLFSEFAATSSQVSSTHYASSSTEVQDGSVTSSEIGSQSSQDVINHIDHRMEVGDRVTERDFEVEGRVSADTSQQIFIEQHIQSDIHSDTYSDEESDVDSQHEDRPPSPSDFTLITSQGPETLTKELNLTDTYTTHIASNNELSPAIDQALMTSQDSAELDRALADDEDYDSDQELDAEDLEQDQYHQSMVASQDPDMLAKALGVDQPQEIPDVMTQSHDPESLARAFGQEYQYEETDKRYFEQLEVPPSPSDFTLIASADQDALNRSLGVSDTEDQIETTSKHKTEFESEFMQRQMDDLLGSPYDLSSEVAMMQGNDQSVDNTMSALSSDNGYRQEIIDNDYPQDDEDEKMPEPMVSSFEKLYDGVHIEPEPQSDSDNTQLDIGDRFDSGQPDLHLQELGRSSSYENLYEKDGTIQKEDEQVLKGDSIKIEEKSTSSGSEVAQLDDVAVEEAVHGGEAVYGEDYDDSDPEHQGGYAMGGDDVDDKSTRLLMKKEVHSRTVLGTHGQEETFVLEDTQIQQDQHPPEELKESMQQIISQFMDTQPETEELETPKYLEDDV